MRSAIPIPLSKANRVSNEQNLNSISQHKFIKKLVWAYFFLLLFEGALREMVSSWIIPRSFNYKRSTRDLDLFFMLHKGFLSYKQPIFKEMFSVGFHSSYCVIFNK